MSPFPITFIKMFPILVMFLFFLTFNNSHLLRVAFSRQAGYITSNFCFVSNEFCYNIVSLHIAPSYILCLVKTLSPPPPPLSAAPLLLPCLSLSISSIPHPSYLNIKT